MKRKSQVQRFQFLSKWLWINCYLQFMVSLIFKQSKWPWNFINNIWEVLKYVPMSARVDGMISDHIPSYLENFFIWPNSSEFLFHRDFFVCWERGEAWIFLSHFLHQHHRSNIKSRLVLSHNFATAPLHRFSQPKWERSLATWQKIWILRANPGEQLDHINIICIWKSSLGTILPLPYQPLKHPSETF